MIQNMCETGSMSIKQGDCSDWAGKPQTWPNPWNCHRCVLPAPDNSFALECGWHSGWKNVERRCPCPLMSKVETCLAAYHSLQSSKVFSLGYLMQVGQRGRLNGQLSIHKGSFVFLSTSWLQANYSDLEGSVYYCDQAQCLKHDLTSRLTWWIKIHSGDAMDGKLKNHDKSW